ncbi:MAG: glycoside hydrolase, partial [Gammaproteobacteria bacterium]
MTTPAQLDLVFLWHMHQPDYRDPRDGRYVLPWTYLHGIKDYTDMAAHLERHPGLRAVVNFVPVLVEQIDEYARAIAAGVPCDPLLALLAREDFTTLSDAERDLVSTACFRANHHHMLEPFPPYRRLRDLDALVGEDASPRHYLSGRYYADLVTWYHLVWLGESVRRDQPWVVDLIGKGGDYSSAERRRLFDLVGCELGRIAARYRALRERGQVELSTTPYAHPLGPLLFGFGAAREAVPDLALPAHPAYSDGAARFAEHCRLARTLHDSRFGAPPRGAWPAEGALSAPVLEALGDHDFAWTASGEAVLAHTLRA